MRIKANDIVVSPQIDIANATFSTCTAKNLAIIKVPISAEVPSSLNVRIRYSTSSTVIDSASEQYAYIGGTLMLTYELNSRIVYTRPSIDIKFFGNWQSSPSEWNLGDLQSIQLNTFLDDFVSKLSFDKKRLQTLLRSKDEKLTCSPPSFIAMSCTANTRIVPQSCHPCDTCCNCMIRQVCDGSCSECPCVNCSFSSLWLLSIFLLLCSVWIIYAYLY